MARVGLIGYSYGGGLALLVAATFPDLVGPVVAYTPTNVVWQGLEGSGPEQQRSSWSHHGSPLPFVPFPPGVGPGMSDRGLTTLAIYDKGLDQPEATGAAVIPVERATGPLLVISGGDDQIHPAKRSCQLLVERMNRCDRAADIRHLHYPDAGHMLTPWPQSSNVEAPPVTFDFGSDEAAAAADADARPQVLAHLRSSLVA
jgi:pimeloyl-ACP methyl ester carboxylesterase